MTAEDLPQFTINVNDIAFYTDCFIFACLFPVELWVFIRLKFKVDNSGILTLLLHLTVSIIRIIRDINDKIVGLIVVTGILIYISLHYFTFEMWLIKITLTSDDYKTRLKQKNRVILIKILDTIFMLIFMVLNGVLI